VGRLGRGKTLLLRALALSIAAKPARFICRAPAGVVGSALGRSLCFISPAARRPMRERVDGETCAHPVIPGAARRGGCARSVSRN